MNTEKVIQERGPRVKYDLDLTKVPGGVELMEGLIKKANDKKFGKKITGRQILAYALKKLSDKDIEKLKEESMDSKDILSMKHLEYVKKTGKDISIWDFALKAESKGKLH